MLPCPSKVIIQQTIEVGITTLKCVICHQLRGQIECQKMADLPADRLAKEPPFTSIGLDVFVPWTIVTHYSRGGSTKNKWWEVIFTCMATTCIVTAVFQKLSISRPSIATTAVVMNGQCQLSITSAVDSQRAHGIKDTTVQLTEWLCLCSAPHSLRCHSMYGLCI